MRLHLGISQVGLGLFPQRSQGRQTKETEKGPVSDLGCCFLLPPTPLQARMGPTNPTNLGPQPCAQVQSWACTALGK